MKFSSIRKEITCNFFFLQKIEMKKIMIVKDLFQSIMIKYFCFFLNLLIFIDYLLEVSVELQFSIYLFLELYHEL